MIIPIAQTKRNAPFDAHFQQGHICGECKGLLVEATCGQEGMLWVGCSNRSHEGFERVRSYWERWKAGEVLPPGITEGLRQREEKGNRGGLT